MLRYCNEVKVNRFIDSFIKLKSTNHFYCTARDDKDCAHGIPMTNVLYYKGLAK